MIHYIESHEEIQSAAHYRMFKIISILISTIAILFVGVLVASAQSQPPLIIRLPEEFKDFSIDEGIDVDGDSSTEEYLLTNWQSLERVVMAVCPNRQIVFGRKFRTIWVEFYYWAFPMKLNGKTVLVTDLLGGSHAAQSLDYPPCPK